MPRAPSHFEDLERLLELERAAEAERFHERKQALTPKERVARGYALDDLEAVDERPGLGGRLILTFERPERAPIDGDFEPGAMVELTPRKAEVAEPARAVIAKRRRTSLELAFDDTPPEFVTAGRVWLEATPNDLTHRRLRQGLGRWRAMERGVERRRRDVLLGADAARFSTRPEPAWRRALNAEQQLAVRRALEAEDVFLVHGPPGTGKSTVLAEVATQAVGLGHRLLATAASNAAVDHLLELCLDADLRAVRVGHPARVAERFHAHTLDAMVEQHDSWKLARELFDQAFDLMGYARKQRTRGRSRERFSNARDAKQEARECFRQARELERQAVRAVLDGAQVVCATCATLPGGELAGESFDLVLFDEATQATEPTALLAFLKAPRVVLAGDHQQLPPTVLSQRAAREGLAVSLFERLLEEHGESVKVMLREQYRMHEQLMGFPSRMMYGGELRAHASAASRDLAELVRDGGLDLAPLVFLDTAGKGFDDEAAEGTDSLRNPGEADLVLERLRRLRAAGVAGDAIGIITPYGAQAALLRRLVEAEGVQDVEIDTIDAFQGREKDVVLLSLTRSNQEGRIGFLSDLRRMNVAMTRARRQLWAVGDSATLSQHPFYAAFVEEAQALGGYRSAWDAP